MKIVTVVGLGNPEPEYAWSRHNIGYRVLNALAASRGVSFTFDDKLGALTGQFALDQDTTVLLVKPQINMNLSGTCLAAVMEGQPLDSLLLVYDDIAIDLGRMRFAFDSSAGGHRGVEDIHRRLDTRKFARLKVGLGPAPKGDKKPFVTLPVEEALRAPMLLCAERAAASVPSWIYLGTEKACNKYNGCNLLAD